MNSIGTALKLTTFGESHGVGIGGVLDGLPAGFSIDLEAIRKFVSLRRPGSSPLVSARHEPDEIEFLSGLSSSMVSLGSPIAFFVKNIDARSSDYNNLSQVFRPSHADYCYHIKYGGYYGATGGGRASARESVARCVAGNIAMQWLQKEYGVSVFAYVSQVGTVRLPQTPTIQELQTVYQYPSRCPHTETNQAIQTYLQQMRAARDSVGGIVTCAIHGVPAGWGEPLYHKLHAHLSYSLLSINAAKGIEFGDGFVLAEMQGSVANDSIRTDSKTGEVKFTSNHSGGIQGGISNGAPILMRVAFKPTPTIGLAQKTIDVHGNSITLQAAGRHDPCVAIRAVPIVQSMAALTLADAALVHKKHL